MLVYHVFAGLPHTLKESESLEKIFPLNPLVPDMNKVSQRLLLNTYVIGHSFMIRRQVRHFGDEKKS